MSKIKEHPSSMKFQSCNKKSDETLKPLTNQNSICCDDIQIGNWEAEIMDEKPSHNHIYQSLVFDNKLAYDKGNIVDRNKEKEEIKQELYIVKFIPRNNFEASNQMSLYRLGSIPEAPSVDEYSHYSKLMRFHSKSIMSSAMNPHSKQFINRLPSDSKLAFHPSAIYN